MAAEAHLSVKVQTPEAIIWEGEAEAVSSENSMGPFDLLPDHANIVTLIERKPITVETTTGSRVFNFERAIISMRENHVLIFADIAARGKEVRPR